MAQRYQRLSTLTWVCSIPCGSKPLSSQWRHSDTSVCQRYLHAMSGARHQCCDWSQRKTLIEIPDDETRPGTPIPQHQNPSQWYWVQSCTKSLYHHHSHTMQHGAHWRCLDGHGSQWKVELGQGSGGEGIGRCHRLSSGHGIANVCITCNSARYLVCSRYSFSLIRSHSPAIWPLLKESFSISNLQPIFDCTSTGMASPSPSTSGIVLYDTCIVIGPMTAQTASLKEAMCFLPAMELSRGGLTTKISSPFQLSRPSSSPAWRHPEKQNGYSNWKKIFTVLRGTDPCCRSNATIRVLSL